jgi:hypothetical protein
VKKRKKTFDQKKEVRALARERLGRVKPSRPILPESARKKPKHKKPLEGETNGENESPAKGAKHAKISAGLGET